MLQPVLFFTIAILLCATAPAQDTVANKIDAAIIPASKLTQAKPDTFSISTLQTVNGEYITICGKAIKVRYLKKEPGKPVVMKLQGANEKEKREIYFMFKDKGRLPRKPEKLFLNKRLCYNGYFSIHNDTTFLIIDSTNQYQLFQKAKFTAVEPTKPKYLATQPLITNAYLLAGPNLSEDIITLLKKGSIVTPYYIKKNWAYVLVIEKFGDNEKPRSLNGFIRAQSLDLKRKSGNPGLD